MANPSFQYYHGLNVLWALGPTTISVSNATGIYQSADVEQVADRVVGKDQRNTTVATVDSDPRQTVTLEFIVSDLSTPNVGNAAVSYPYPGVMVSISANSSNPLNNTIWIVDNVTVREIYNDLAKCTLKCTLYYGVTS